MNKPKNKGGRPRKEIDMALLARLCKLQCTAVECAGALNVCEETLNTRLKEKTGEGFPEFFKKHTFEGKISLRREQFVQAMSGNITMLIWLGKQWLEQKDVSRIEQTGADGGAMSLSLSADAVIAILKKKIGPDDAK